MLEDAENGLTVLFRELLSELYEEMKHLDERVEKLEQKLETIAANNEACKLLLNSLVMMENFSLQCGAEHI
ncbi:hypothetical protein J7438_01750 [Thalassotalea sp. G20_0]|uniref:hypothetical protein n=1 Tax=Thalassotalea sp. G20_0 TaxID=2821093 RepID=UPI001ADBAC5D|nr:hypothetical protein [Thalassotalea sp. G20_0]MBO9492817.1 hypothetical protein [Thalassotalea sp. G20_0]